MRAYASIGKLPRAHSETAKVAPAITKRARLCHNGVKTPARAGGGGDTSGGSHRVETVTERPAHLHGIAELLDDSVGCQFAVSQLRALVLRHRADDRPELREHAPALRDGQPGRFLDVEERLGARRGLLGVLPARPARAGEAE